MNPQASAATFTFQLLAASLFAVATSPAASGDLRELTSANTSFAFQLLTEIFKEQPEQNIFISPYSVSTVLQMVENGAGGKTKAEMRQALGIADLSQAAQNEANRDLSRSINATTTNLILNTANAIWYRQGIPVRPAFIACNQNFYQATVEELNFDDPATVGHINSWAKEKTHGKIPSIVSGPVDPATYLYLANAVYFKGDWAKPFKVENTKEREFHLRGGKTKRWPMMFQGGRFSYCQGDGYQAVRLPYQGWNVSLYVFLPAPNSSPEQLVATLSGDHWRQTTVRGFTEHEGTLVLPRFKFEYAVDLKPPLRALGIRNAFSAGAADFSALCDQPVFISGAMQKTFIEVNEKGTEAAAVTLIEAETASIRAKPPKPFQMIVDRPYLFVIEHRPTGTILFLGISFDPSRAG